MIHPIDFRPWRVRFKNIRFEKATSAEGAAKHIHRRIAASVINPFRTVL
jgi:hypothetical protein